MVTRCSGCSRRDLLQGLGVAAVGALVVAAGCEGEASLPTAISARCGAGRCLDLSDAANKELTAAGGAMLVDTSDDTIMVIRISDTQVVALSAICTHASCTMDYDASRHLLDCPCHGSQFSADGKVVRGPANRPLHVYSAALANDMITIT